jgi:hypothetical protein
MARERPCPLRIRIGDALHVHLIRPDTRSDSSGRVILRIDPSPAEALRTGPPQNLEEPFLLEYLDRLIAALTLKVAGKGLAALISPSWLN